MKTSGRGFQLFLIISAVIGLAAACGYDDSLREYLDARFWLPFSKQESHFEKRNITRLSIPFAGMATASGHGPLATLRAAYQEISQPTGYDVSPQPDIAGLSNALTAAQHDPSLTPHERNEVELLDAKIEMRIGESEGGSPDILKTAAAKLQTFLSSSAAPELLSEARGWLAHVYYQLGDQSGAGKIYLDELNRNGSNLSRETVLDSLKMTYDYDGGAKLASHLGEYFDTPEHAAFAIQIATNPRWDIEPEEGPRDAETYASIKSLLEKNKSLFDSAGGSDTLALLSMRTALRMGDPPEVLKLAAMIPARASIRKDVDFEWMLASSRFLSHDFTGAEAPLLDLFHSRRATSGQRAAAAYGLCGVYRKAGNFVQQIYFVLWLQNGYSAVENSTG